MKKILVSCVLVFTFNICTFSQGISHEQLIGLSFKNFYETKDILVQNDFYQISEKKQDQFFVVEFDNSYLGEKISLWYLGNIKSSKKSITLETKSRQMYSDFVKFVHQKGCKNTSSKYNSTRITEWSCNRVDIMIFDGEERIKEGNNPEIVTPLYSFTIYPK